MKRVSPLILLLACSLASPALFAAEMPAPVPECLLKSQDISNKLQQAKADGDKRQQAGLEKALSEANANCSEASLLKQREQKVLEAKREVSRRQTDLNQAMAKGDPEKINKRKDKLAESRKELLEAQAELEKVQD
ncbi:DUF1090 domain-containing protein [Pseudomonas syringae]|nr:DUF1090 domain-containing protein [Pseudomonas syringae]MBD8576170.1 DUF1090 domain-containing protein [Pseudomonas syringae]MBD8792204.1 DUF1090 domain-containing protein [Pseudomonas syringae]MBD8804139.1 DUF1090 domain-containing protein [Pseudomonas syringae]MBD8814335.1 DUF1090 domain-containing protein [Pseudomonas syringae]